MIGHTNDEKIFWHKLLLINRHVRNLGKAFRSDLSVSLVLWKTQTSEIIESVWFLCRFLGPLLKIGLVLMNNILQALAKIVLIALGLAAAASVADIKFHLKKSWFVFF